ncbi:hypothetical protein RR46_11706 [Papilio xuthus]|uniref:Uncharacterized protein n=1 Tax=Papilio xuthus TaxID=66420 RepID=A0A194PSP8_PAPXU|nr:hypothetical protein RR46_11706 [Papilio xuthus]
MRAHLWARRREGGGGREPEARAARPIWAVVAGWGVGECDLGTYLLSDLDSMACILRPNA